MGVPGLWKLVEGASETWSLRTLALREGFEGLRAERLYYVGIDSSIWMQSMLHQFSAGHAQSGENPELYHLFSRLAMLAERPIHAVFVADGPHRPAYKRGKQVKLPPVWLTDGFRRLVEAFGFAWLEAAGEAEAELAKMSSLGLIDAVMTDDSDTLIFGAAVIIRNPSFKRAGSDKVTVYRRSKVLDKTGFSEDDLLLFALLVGCDYDECGLRNCGAQIAAGLVRYGLGRVLRRALDTYDDDQLSIYLQGWRDQVRVRLRDDPGKHIGRKSPRLAANVPATFPKVEAARLFATPALLPPSAYEAVLQPRAMDFGRLGTACETFFGWGSTAELVQTFRSALWPDEVVRMLVREGLSHEGITSRVGRAHPLLDLSVESVGKSPASGYAMCRVKVIDLGLGDVVKNALYGTRPYSSTAKLLEGDALRESKEPLSMQVPAVILERARPWLITPAYKTEGYNYGQGGRDLRGGVDSASSLTPTKKTKRATPTKKTKRAIPSKRMQCASPSKKPRLSQGNVAVQDAHKSACKPSSSSSLSLHACSSSAQTTSSPSSSRTAMLPPLQLTCPTSSASNSGSGSSCTTMSKLTSRHTATTFSLRDSMSPMSPRTFLYSYFSLTPPSSSAAGNPACASSPTSASVSSAHTTAPTASPSAATSGSLSRTGASASTSCSTSSPSSSRTAASTSSTSAATSGSLSRTTASTSSPSAAARGSSSRTAVFASIPSSTSSRSSSRVNEPVSTSRTTSSPLSLHVSASTPLLSAASSGLSSGTSASLVASSLSCPALEIPRHLEDVIDLTIPSPPRPRRAHKLQIIDLTEEHIIDLTL